MNTVLKYIKKNCNFTHMAKRYFIYVTLIILLLVFGFDKSNDDPFSKFKTLTQVIRLVQEGY